jgi:hypothetical protein
MVSPIRLIGDFSSESSPINADSLTVRSESDFLSPFDEETINNTMINSITNNNNNNNNNNVSAILLRSGLRYPRTPPPVDRTNNNHNNDITNHSPTPTRIRFNIP